MVASLGSSIQLAVLSQLNELTYPPVMVSDGESIVAIFSCPLSDEELPLSAMLRGQKKER